MVTKVKKVAPLTSAFNVQGISSDWYDKMRSMIYAINRGIENINDLQEQSDALAERATSLEGRMDTAEDNIQNLLDRVSVNEGKIANLEEFTQQLDEALSALTTRVETNEDNIETLQEDVVRINAAIDVINGQIAKINETLEAHDGRITINEQDIVDIKAKDVEQDQELEMIQEEQVIQNKLIEGLRTDVTAIQEEQVVQNGRLDGLDSKTDATNKVVADHTEKLEGLRTDVDTNKGLIDDLDKDFADLQVAFTALQEDITKKVDALQVAVTVNINSIAAINSHVTLLDNLYHELETRISNNKSASETKDTELEGKIAELREALDQLEAEVGSLNEIKTRMLENEGKEGYVWTSTAENPSGEWQESKSEDVRYKTTIMTIPAPITFKSVGTPTKGIFPITIGLNLGETVGTVYLNGTAVIDPGRNGVSKIVGSAVLASNDTSLKTLKLHLDVPSLQESGSDYVTGTVMEMVTAVYDSLLYDLSNVMMLTSDRIVQPNINFNLGITL